MVQASRSFTCSCSRAILISSFWSTHCLLLTLPRPLGVKEESKKEEEAGLALVAPFAGLWYRRAHEAANKYAQYLELRLQDLENELWRSSSVFPSTFFISFPCNFSL